MKKVCLICASMVIPTVVFAEVNFNLSIRIPTEECQSSAEIEYVDEGEPWFEECDNSNSDSRLCFEYQWTVHGSAYVLRYRQVSFRTFSNAWVFGPWMIKENCCHSSCKIHHTHIYHHHHAPHPNWHRVYNHVNHVYHYEYRDHPKHDRHGHYKVYRHEYRPPHHNHNAHVNNHKMDGHKQNHNYYRKPQSHNNHREFENKSGYLNKKSVAQGNNENQRVNQSKYHDGNHGKTQNSNHQKITRISGRQ